MGQFCSRNQEFCRLKEIERADAYMSEDKGRYYFAGEAPQIFIVPGHTTQSQQIIRVQSTFVAIQHNLRKKPESSLILGCFLHAKPWMMIMWQTFLELTRLV